MKLNKFTSALLALGALSLAGVAHANTVIYVTGSTAARSAFFNAATTSGQIFTGAGTVISTGANNTGSGANTIVYEGNIAGVGTVDLNCSWTGSEAGIAAVAGQVVQQNVNSGTYNLPGVPPKFLNPANWTVANATPVLLSAISGAPANPDITTADTSQAVSLTPTALFPLVDYGIIGVVPFTVLKGYDSAPSSSWTNLKNVTTAQLNQNLAGPLVANIYTGQSADLDNVVICGRNKGSGTRVNTLLTFQYGLGTPVDQWAYDVTYPVANPGVLTFGKHYSYPQTMTEVFNDGFDSGSGVQGNLNVDGKSSLSSVVMLGYAGMGDAQNAVNVLKAGVSTQLATILPFNGVYESDNGVINGSYAFWGSVHLLGSVGQSSTSAAGKTATAIKTGILANLAAQPVSSLDCSTIAGALDQHVLLPKSLMQVTRSGGDVGFPAQGTTGW